MFYNRKILCRDIAYIFSEIMTCPFNNSIDDVHIELKASGWIPYTIAVKENPSGVGPMAWHTGFEEGSPVFKCILRYIEWLKEGGANSDVGFYRVKPKNHEHLREDIRSG